MKRQATFVAVIVFSLLTIGGLAAIAQGSNASTVYRLNSRSTYQQGCFPPCLCPISEAAAVVGTMVLTPAGTIGLFTTYSVSQVTWKVPTPGGELRVSGEGTYDVSATQQRLQLDLRIDEGTIEHFDSGVVPLGARFPNIKVTISLHGERCFDTVFVVDTSPVPPVDVHPYRLDRGSTFQNGCFPPCECAVHVPEPLSGGFELVDLAPTPLFREFAVMNVNWTIVSPTAIPPTFIRGSGFYQLGGEVALEQEMSLDLTVDDQSLTHFDSGLVEGGGKFPLIDITISIPGKLCTNEVMILKASPQ